MGVREHSVYDHVHVADRIAARAGSDQFRHLPAEAQEEMRARWRAEVQRQIDREDLRLETRIATVLSCVLLFLVVTVVWDVPTRVTVPAAVVVGAVTGLVWNATGAGRFLAVLTVIPGYVLLRVVGPPQSPYVMFFGFVAMSSLAAVAGTMRELREGDLRPSGFARRLRRLLRRDVDPSRLLADRGALDALSPGAHPVVRPWGPAPEQGGDERRPASWTEWDLDACDEEP